MPIRGPSFAALLAAAVLLAAREMCEAGRLKGGPERPGHRFSDTLLPLPSTPL